MMQVRQDLKRSLKLNKMKAVRLKVMLKCNQKVKKKVMRRKARKKVSFRIKQ